MIEVPYFYTDVPISSHTKYNVNRINNLINTWFLYHYIIVLQLKKTLQIHQVVAPVILHNLNYELKTITSENYLNSKMPLIGRLICAFNKTLQELQENKKYFIMVTLSHANKQHITNNRINRYSYINLVCYIILIAHVLENFECTTRLPEA